MSENINMDWELQTRILRAYGRFGITVAEFPFVAMDGNFFWYAYGERPNYDVRRRVWLNVLRHRCFGDLDFSDEPCEDSLYVWNAEAKATVKEKAVFPGLSLFVEEDALARRVWVDLGGGSALRCDVVRVTEPLPMPMERVRYDLPRVEELDGCFARPWSEVCPLDLD